MQIAKFRTNGAATGLLIFLLVCLSLREFASAVPYFIFICGLCCCCWETPKVYQQCILFLCKCGSRSPFATDFIVAKCAAEVILSMLFGCSLYFETCPHFVMCTDLNLLQLAAVLKTVTKESRIAPACQQSFLEIPSSVSVFCCWGGFTVVSKWVQVGVPWKSSPLI